MPTPIFPVLPPGGEPMFTELSHNALHQATALSRLLEQYKDKARLKTLVDIFSEQMQAVEEMFWDLYVKRRLDTADGDQLRVLGRIVGLTKGATNDVDFRILVAAQIRVLGSRGTFKDLLGLIRLVIGTDPSKRSIKEVFPAGLQIELFEVPTFSTVLFGRIMRAAKAAGVSLEISMVPPSGEWFTFDYFGGGGNVNAGFMNFANTSGGYFGRKV